MPFNVGLPELVVLLLMMLACVVVFVIVFRALTGTRKRACPVCGSPVERGLTTCATCQHDFAAAHRA
ncbi:MAG: hypothetical protein QOI73_2481 [Solirubrobacteraceae bacterium]|nr:hypothetical protein [Solirubrobacteraceae bacterium]